MPTQHALLLLAAVAIGSLVAFGPPPAQMKSDVRPTISSDVPRAAAARA
jgi:hypothetical protein